MGEPAQWSGDTPRMLNNCDANASLIAAAPDLYEALELVTEAVRFEDVPSDAAKIILAALAKARGEK